MATIDGFWLAALTKGEDDAGSKDRFALTVNVDGTDVFAQDFFLGWNLPGQGTTGLGEGQAGLEEGVPPTVPVDSAALTNSSIRLGLRGDDAWGPKHALVLGATRAEPGPGPVVALAIETDVVRWLSADSGEGRLTMPIRLVGSGSSATVIRRVLLLVYTDRGDDIDSESDINLQIAASGQLLLDQKITHDLDQVRAYWHFLDVEAPFTRADIVTKGAIHLGILGTDAWLPKTVFVFGLDTAAGRPDEVVTLVSIPKWDLGTLSTDTSEGAPSVPLPVSS